MFRDDKSVKTIAVAPTRHAKHKIVSSPVPVSGEVVVERGDT